jgi:DNA-binding response OmpR family regulator
VARLLIVDDEPNLVDLLHDYLSREGYEVATAADGPAGLEMART